MVVSGDAERPRTKELICFSSKGFASNSESGLGRMDSLSRCVLRRVNDVRRIVPARSFRI